MAVVQIGTYFAIFQDLDKFTRIVSIQDNEESAKRWVSNSIAERDRHYQIVKFETIGELAQLVYVQDD